MTQKSKLTDWSFLWSKCRYSSRKGQEWSQWCAGFHEGFLPLQSADEELSLCGARLLGRGQRRACYLPRLHPHIQSALQRRHKSHQRLRLQSMWDIVRHCVTCATGCIRLLMMIISIPAVLIRTVMERWTFIYTERLFPFFFPDVWLSSDPVPGEPLHRGPTEAHGPSLDLHPWWCFGQQASGQHYANQFPLTWGVWPLTSTHWHTVIA